MTGATDARHYLEISDRVFRFSPFILNREEQETVHGIDERLSIENAKRIVGFMVELIKRMSMIPTDDFGQEDNDFEEEEEVRPVRKKDKPLKTRSGKKQDKELEYDDSPLPTKPMKKVETEEEE
jgi:Na+-translocating ferredoxin:NAD+ oxidoreductase RnfC subunit